MKISFFQAALLLGAVSAVETFAEVESEVEADSYWPDLLVQTASLVDFFYPNTEVESPTYLAEIGSVVEEQPSETLGEIDIAHETSDEVMPLAQNEAESESEVSSESDDDLLAQNLAEDKKAKKKAAKKKAAKKDAKKAASTTSEDESASDSSEEEEEDSGKAFAGSKVVESENGTDWGNLYGCFGKTTKRIGNSDVTSARLPCGRSVAMPCCAQPIDKFKKAFDYLNRDPENSNPQWTEHLKPTDMPEKEPIVVCGNHSGYYATPEDLVNDLPQVECEDELDEEAMDAAW